MEKDSEITEIPSTALDSGADSSNRENWDLIHATASSLVYRTKKDGKYFIVKRSAIKGEKGRKILRREYELSAGASHPNIINVYEYRKGAGGEDEIVMEYVEGRTLSEFLEEKPSLKTRKRIFSELLSAVGYLHQRRIIHNDLKPGNIMVSRTGDHVKLIDLGLSDDDAHYEIKTPGFTEGYAAPELMEERCPDERSDIYSLGMLMHLIFGNRYGYIANKCLRKDPTRRFPDIESLKKRWRRSYLIWLLPVISLVLFLIALVIFSLIRYNQEQNHKLEEFTTAINTRVNELKLQKEASEMRSETASLTDYPEASLIPEADIGQDADKKILSEFKTAYKELSDLALDSIKACEYPNEMSIIYSNYTQRVKELYEYALTRCNDEKTRDELTSIMYRDEARVATQFLEYIKEAEKRINSVLLQESDSDIIE